MFIRQSDGAFARKIWFFDFRVVERSIWSLPTVVSAPRGVASPETPTHHAKTSVSLQTTTKSDSNVYAFEQVRENWIPGSSSSQVPPISNYFLQDSEWSNCFTIYWVLILRYSLKLVFTVSNKITFRLLR